MDYLKQTPGQVKEELRKEALEKEIQRLKITTQKQSKKLHRLRKGMFFLLLFFALLFLMLVINGLLKWPTDSVLTDEDSKSLVENTNPIEISNQPENPIVIPDKIEDGLIFRIPGDGILYSVQIGAYVNIEMTPFEMNLFSLQQYSYEDINQYSAGLFDSYNKAQEFLSIIKQMGFKDAFIISTHYGKRLSIQEAIAIQLTSSTDSTYSQLSGEPLNQPVIEEELPGNNP